jgi:hypothetical protein
MNRNLTYHTALSGVALLGQIAFADAAVSAVPRAASAQLKIDCVNTHVTTAVVIGGQVVLTGRCLLAGNGLPVRRGTTETINIEGQFVNHTSLSGVTTGNSGVTISKVVGSNCSYEFQMPVGCLDVTLSVKSDFNLASPLVPIFIKNAFGTAAFNLHIIRRGEITAMKQNPTDPLWGESVAVSITGTDIGNTRAAVIRSTVANLVKASSSPGPSTTTFTVVASGTPRRYTGVTLGDASVSGIDYGQGLGVTYTSCRATPGISAPILSSPENNQTFTFVDDPVHASITLRWFGKDFKATEQYIVELGYIGGTRTSFTTGQGVTLEAVSLNRNRRYQWRVKAYNCGQSAPFSAYWTFSVQ